jgi:hypothetical protein
MLLNARSFLKLLSKVNDSKFSPSSSFDKRTAAPGYRFVPSLNLARIFSAPG